MPHIPQPSSLKSKSRILWVAPEPRFGIKDLIRGVKFYSKNICRFNQIRYPKRSFFRVISQKNDTIGFATLIAPEIISGIKPGMYGSLFSAHVGCYYLENYCVLDCTRESLHEYCHECMCCRVTSSPSVSPLVAIKGGGEAFARSTSHLAAMAYP